VKITSVKVTAAANNIHSSM